MPAPGGGSSILETRFGRFALGHFDPLTAEGGSLLQSQAINPQAQEVIPPDANVIAKRITTPLFGLGLIEAIPDFAIIQNAHEAKPDNISGRLSTVTDVASGNTRVGRFGWKAQQATLLAKFDTVADPDDQIDPATGKADIDHFADFMRLLAPPPKLAPSPSAKAGQDAFSQIGCTGCHEPTFVTGPNAIKALDRKVVALYSDLLLHDMGSLGDGIVQGTARGSEMKTPPLWGLRARGPYLHDGRAATISAAIRMHDGEAARARDRFNCLGSTQQQQLIAFLNAI